MLAILRAALGTPEIPPTLVITGLALILTAHVMTPTARAIEREVAPLLVRDARRAPLDALSPEGGALLLDAARKAREPVRGFLLRHSGAQDRALFRDLAARLGGPDAAPPGVRDLSVLVPAFAIGELSEAFRIGFLIFLPFLVVDLVIANVLLALGMPMLSPTLVAVPFKLLLFVLVDGWRLIARGLLLGYV